MLQLFVVVHITKGIIIKLEIYSNQNMEVQVGFLSPTHNDSRAVALVYLIKQNLD